MSRATSPLGSDLSIKPDVLGRLRYSIRAHRRPRSLLGLLRLWWVDFVIHPLFEACEACEDCGRSYVCWGAPDELWELVMGCRGGLLCPACFSDRCEAKGVIVRFEATVLRRL